MKISAVYKIMNTVTNKCYVGSSKNVIRRWAEHKCPSTWKKLPNSKLYLDMQKYGLDNFRFQILVPVMEEYLTQVEQEFIELLHPAYNEKFAKGWDVERRKERHKEYQKEYFQTERGREVRRKGTRKYRKTNKGKEINRKQARKDMKKYHNQLCSYNGEILTLNTLSARFIKAKIEHPTLEAKKYLLNKQ